MTAGTKVTVSKEVAEAIEGLRSKYPEYKDASNFIEEHAGVRANPDDDSWLDYPVLNIVSTEVFARAILNGYEIEKTPEEKLREYFNEANVLIQVSKTHYNLGVRDAVRKTIDILGITIEGINAD